MNFDLDLRLDLERFKTNQRAKCLGQRSFWTKVVVQTHRRTHKRTGLIASPGPPKWSATNCLLCTLTVVAVHLV